MRGLVSAAVVRRNNGEDTTITTAVGNDPRLAPLDDDVVKLRSLPWSSSNSSE